MASAPTWADGISDSPEARSSASIASAACSAASPATGRRVSALRRPEASFSRSNSWRHAVALDDDEAGGLDALVGREPGRAGGALAAAADRRGVVEVARVHDPRLPLAAMRAAHRPSWRHTTRGCGVSRGYHYIRGSRRVNARVFGGDARTGNIRACAGPGSGRGGPQAERWTELRDGSTASTAAASTA